MRKWIIFGLTHFYPLFIAGHLYFGDWSRAWQVIFNTVPIIVFGGLVLTWVQESHLRLSKFEKSCLNYFLINLTFIYLYYSLCSFSLPAWVMDRNWQVSAFVLITFGFYIYKHYRERK